MLRWPQTVFTSLIFLLIFPALAAAQMGNEPFSFKNGSGSVGMSTAGKQAIIIQKLTGATPSVLLRGPFGHLLGLAKGPGDTAIVTSPSGEFLPSYRGRSWRGSNPAFDVLAFNAYFLAANETTWPFPGFASTGAVIDSWTGNVIYGRPSGAGGSSVDQWTDMVHYLR